MSELIAGIRIPDGKLAQALTRDLLRRHGTEVAARTFSEGLLVRSDQGPSPWAEVRSGELLCFGAVFHDLRHTREVPRSGASVRDRW